jgi:hypothetical protein
MSRYCHVPPSASLLTSILRCRILISWQVISEKMKIVEAKAERRKKHREQFEAER